MLARAAFSIHHGISAGRALRTRRIDYIMLSMKKNMLELIRYGLVGALATLVDWAVLYIGTEYLFAPLKENAVYPAHVLSFLSGLIVNFILSNLFVFTADSQKGKGNNAKAFFLFAVIGVIGLGLTELGAWAADRLYGSATVVWTIGMFKIKVYLITKVIVLFLIS